LQREVVVERRIGVMMIIMLPKIQKELLLTHSQPLLEQDGVTKKMQTLLSKIQKEFLLTHSQPVWELDGVTKQNPWKLVTKKEERDNFPMLRMTALDKKD